MAELKLTNNDIKKVRKRNPLPDGRVGKLCNYRRSGTRDRIGSGEMDLDELHEEHALRLFERTFLGEDMDVEIGKYIELDYKQRRAKMPTSRSNNATKKCRIRKDLKMAELKLTNNDKDLEIVKLKKLVVSQLPILRDKERQENRQTQTSPQLAMTDGCELDDASEGGYLFLAKLLLDERVKLLRKRESLESVRVNKHYQLKAPKSVLEKEFVRAYKTVEEKIIENEKQQQALQRFKSSHDALRFDLNLKAEELKNKEVENRALRAQFAQSLPNIADAKPLLIPPGTYQVESTDDADIADNVFGFNSYYNPMVGDAAWQAKEESVGVMDRDGNPLDQFPQP